MQQRTNLKPLIMAIVIALVLTRLMVVADAQAQIAFVSNRDGNWEIYVMNTDGGNQRNLTNNPAADLAPSWSPDGKRIVFQSDRGGPVNVRPCPSLGSTSWRPMETILKDSPIMAIMTGIPHGPLTANGLPSVSGRKRGL